MSSSSESDDPGMFADLTFFIHGQWAGRTYARVARLVKDNGGRVVKDVGDIDLSHAIVSGQLWSRQGTVSADLTIRAIIAANEDNRSEEDENQNRVWLLPLEWLETSVEEGRKLSEVEHDFERTADVRAAERAKQIREETKALGGKSRFARGERKRYEREQAFKKEVALQAKMDKDGVTSGLDAFSGISPDPTSTSTNAVKPQPTAAVAFYKQDDFKPKSNSKASTSAGDNPDAALAAALLKKKAKAAAAAARDDSKPLKPTSGSKPTDTGNKKLKLKRKRSSAPKIPVIRDDSSDEDLPVVFVADKRRSSDSGPSVVEKKKREVIVVDTETDSDDVHQVPAKKKKTAPLREVSPEL